MRMFVGILSVRWQAIEANVKALLSVAEIEKQKLNYAEKFIWNTTAEWSTKAAIAAMQC